MSPVADLGATFDQFSSGGGTGVIEGVTYPLVYVGFSSGTFTTPTATLTELGSSLVDVPFTFAGVMNGFLEHPLTRPSDALPIFTVELGGSGRASARFFGLVDDNGARVYRVFPDSIRYDFTRSEPVPEPGTLLLVGGALGGLILVRAGSRGRRGSLDARVVCASHADFAGAAFTLEIDQHSTSARSVQTLPALRRGAIVLRVVPS